MRGPSNAALFRWSVILVILLCLTVAVGGTSARADICEGAGTVTASALNLRSEPSTSSSILTTLPRGAVVLITGDTDGWYKIWYRGESGYVSKSYISFALQADSDFGTGTVTGSGVNVRSGPSTAYSAVGTASEGDTMSVTGVSGGWFKVRYKDADAYLYSDYMSVSWLTGGSTAPEAPSPSPSGTAGVITGNYVRMRSGPGTGYSVLGTYNSGTKMTITGSSGDWYAVSCNGLQGYVYKQYLSQSGVTADVEEMDDVSAVTTTGVNLREGPSTAYASKRLLAAGSYVTITGKSGQWYRVDYGGITGYIYQDYLSTSYSDDDGRSLAPSTAGGKIVAEAKKYQGVRYVYGGASPSGFDCSGFVYYVYKQCGYSITRTATSQSYDGVKVARGDMVPGDIIIFLNGAKSAIGHAGIYIGNGQFIHASSGSGRVVISSLSSSYYDTRFYTARRVA